MAINPKLEPGDRVVCYYMEGENTVVPVGTTGTVKKIVKVPFGMGLQYSVDWDNGSSLDLLPETDAWDYEEENIFDGDDIVTESIDKLKTLLVDDGLNPDDFESEIAKLNDEDITDEFLRNLDRKLFKTGDNTELIKNYINKYVDSLKIRAELGLTDDEGEDDDFDEDLLMYGGVEPQKSKIKKKRFIQELRPLQIELLKLQEMVKNSGKPFVVVFEGRDSAGKGTVIRMLTQYLDPKYFKVVALGIPTPEERKDWFQRYEREMEPNKMIFFDRSWYNRGIVEPVMGYSSYDEYVEFMANVSPFEKRLVGSGIPLFKFWFSITPETQQKRFDLRQASPLKYWKYSPNDARSLDKWDDYSKYKKRAILKTKEAAPWYLVDTNDKRAGILNALRIILSKTDYPDKDEENIGMVFPEIVTTVTEGIYEELTPTKNSKLLNEVSRLDDIFSKAEIYDLLSVDEWETVNQFFRDLRDTSIVNMLGAAPYIYAPWDWIEDQYKWLDLSGDQEDAISRLKLSHDKARNTIIRAALKSVGDSDDLNKINRKVQELSRKILIDLFQNY
jgi:polyphosphate kinase 2